MKRLSVPAKVGVSIGVGIGLGIGLINLSANSSSKASPPSSAAMDASLEQLAQNMPAQESISINTLESAGPANVTNVPATADVHKKQVTPASSAALVEISTQPNTAIAQTLTQTIPGVATCPYAQATQTNGTGLKDHHYVYHSVDLNGDRQDEVIVQVIGPMTCGTGGCSTLILQPSADTNDATYDVVTQMSLANFPMVVSDRTSHEWNNLLVMVSGGGAEPGYRQLKFDGQSYPTNPTLEPFVTADVAELAGTKVVMNEDVRAIAPVIAAPGCEV